MRARFRGLIVLVALVLFVVIAAALLIPRTTTDAAGTVTLAPDADSYVNASSPSTNYGTATVLRVDSSPDLRSYLRFTVAGLNGQPITQAVLQVYANSSSTAGLSARQVADNTWGETTLTYGNMPALGTLVWLSGAVTSGAWTELDVSSYVTREGTYSFGITTPGATAISLASRESGAHAPRLVLTLGGSPAPTPTPVSVPGSIKHVFLIVMENKAYEQVWNSNLSPYINSLGNAYARAINFYAITHPSLPNYLDMYAGSNYGITTDCKPSASCHAAATNLADNLEAKGLTWKGYMESMPSPCYLTDSGDYVAKHNPLIYFDDIRTNSARCNSHVVSFSALSGDLKAAATTPNYAFISPNNCNDMHSCSIKTGDAWLQSNVPAILASPACTSEKCLVVITWDEDNGHYSNHVLTVFAGPGAKTGGVASGTHYTLYSLLRTVESIFGLPTQTSNDAAASVMSDMLK